MFKYLFFPLCLLVFSTTQAHAQKRSLRFTSSIRLFPSWTSSSLQTNPFDPTQERNCAPKSSSDGFLTAYHAIRITWFSLLFIPTTITMIGNFVVRGQQASRDTLRDWGIAGVVSASFGILAPILAVVLFTALGNNDLIKLGIMVQLIISGLLSIVLAAVTLIPSVGNLTTGTALSTPSTLTYQPTPTPSINLVKFSFM
ncbi:MAG: hypothetical protein H6728_01295 [Myxococcales bacterium]|nr:hypothetical protein [Myxococcales bacterium]MCB9641688.1 hypothetical protein [Myxococcales bacterium]